MTIEQRLERVESQNRRLKWALTAIVGIAVVGGIMGFRSEREDSVVGERAKAVPTVVQAGRFEVVDLNGKVVAVMGMNRDRTGGVVFTNNQHGVLVAQMGAADDERGVVWTYDDEGNPRESIR
jgi:hypothetical protein